MHGKTKIKYQSDVSLHEINTRTALLRVLLQQVVIISYRLLEETYRYMLQGSRIQLSRNFGKKLPLLAA